MKVKPPKKEDLVRKYPRPATNPFDVIFDRLDEIEGMVKMVYEEVRHPKSNSDGQGFLTSKGAAEYLNCSTNAIRLKIKQGRLRSIQKNNRHYFDRDYLKNFVYLGALEANRLWDEARIQMLL